MRHTAGGTMLPLGPLPDTRYPDPRIEVLDKRFRYKQGNAAIERIATGFRWAEGPVYSATAVT
jgi:gluconolactonase